MSFKAVANHQIIDDPLYVEVLHHTMVTKKRTEAFVGRKQLLQKVIRAFQIRPTLSNLRGKRFLLCRKFSDHQEPEYTAVNMNIKLKF